MRYSYLLFDIKWISHLFSDMDEILRNQISFSNKMGILSLGPLTCPLVATCISIPFISIEVKLIFCGSLLQDIGTLSFFFLEIFFPQSKQAIAHVMMFLLPMFEESILL